MHFNKASDGLGGSGYRLLCLNRPKYVMYLAHFNPSESEVISTCGAANSPGTAIASLLSLNPNNWVVVSGTPLAGDWSGRTPANGYDNYWVPSGCSIQGWSVVHFNVASDGLGGSTYRLVCLNSDWAAAATSSRLVGNSALWATP